MSSHPEGGQPPPLGTLRDAFSIQDKLVQQNAPVVQAELMLIDRGLALAFEVAALLEADDAPRRALTSRNVSISDMVIRGLLYGARAALVSAVRLFLYGAHVDSQALIRSAFEATYHANYFRLIPADVDEWIKLGEIVDTDEFSVQHDKWQRDHRPRGNVEQLEAGSNTLRRVFRERSSYGTHANPKTAGLRLVSDLPRMANGGYASTGNTGFARICAMHTVRVLQYVLSEYSDGFGGHLSQDTALASRLATFDSDVVAWLRTLPPRLSHLPEGGR